MRASLNPADRGDGFNSTADLVSTGTIDLYARMQDGQRFGPQADVLVFAAEAGGMARLRSFRTYRARRRGIATVTVINNNSGFGQGWPNLVRQQGNLPGKPEEMLRFGPTDFAKVAESFGVAGIRVTEPGAIGPALKRALDMDEPVVVDVVTDIDVRAPEPWLP